MKIGIYTNGLTQSFQEESVEKYATRFLNEYRSNFTGVHFKLKAEKIKYGDQNESTVVSILKEAKGETEVVYRFYEFKYKDILIDRFNKSNILIKNLKLLWLVMNKFPNLILRLIKPGSFSHPGQTMYLFFIFFIIALSIVFILPVALGLILNFIGTEAYLAFVETSSKIIPFPIGWEKIIALLTKTSEIFLSVTALLLIMIPEAKVVVTSLATEFVCANNYLEVGAQSQQIHGNIDQLIEYIAENEPGIKIHYHSFSFGTLIMFDILFPFGTVPSKNIQDLSEALITVGSPAEFTRAYFTGYFDDRCMLLDKKLSWLNVYSKNDALGSNFRKDNNKGDAQFGIENNSMKPYNLNYEITNAKQGVLSGIQLNGIKTHSQYWDPSPEGLSCMRLVFNEMQKQNLI